MAKFIKSVNLKKDYPQTNGEVVFIGRSNVGKSSLINSLYGKVAYVGKTPGKTKLLNFFDVDGKYTVCDVPGYGFANRSYDELIAFGQMMEDYFARRDALKLCVSILDIRHKPTKDDMEMLSFLKESQIPYLIVLNKADKISGNERVKNIKMFSELLGIEAQKLVYVSTLKKTNIDLLKEKIENYLI